MKSVLVAKGFDEEALLMVSTLVFVDEKMSEVTIDKTLEFIEDNSGADKWHIISAAVAFSDGYETVEDYYEDLYEEFGVRLK